MSHTPFRLSGLTVALLALAGVAQAQSSVTVYGAIGLDVVSATHVYNGTRTGSVVKVDDNAIVNSRIGFKGSEDLGGGLKAQFGLESSVRPDTGTAGNGGTTFFNRGSYVGLAGDFGSVRVGRQWNVADDYMGNYFAFGFYSAFLLGGFGPLSDLTNNAIKYTTPKIGGVEAGLFYGLGEQAGRTSAGQTFQAALNYAEGPVGVGGVAYSAKSPTAGVGATTMYALGASYQFGAVKARVGVATADVKDVTAAGTYKANVVDFGVDVPLSAQASLSLDYVKYDKKDSDDDTAFFRARGAYALSKRTTLNANVIFLNNSGNADFAFVTQGRGFAGKAGQSQTVLTAGITHAF